MVSGFTQTYSSQEPALHSTPAKQQRLPVRQLARAVGRQAVRLILASMRCSTRQLKAAAAAATSQMPAQATSQPQSSRSGRPGTASTMPITAQNTISCTTRGLVSA